MKSMATHVFSDLIAFYVLFPGRLSIPANPLGLVQSSLTTVQKGHFTTYFFFLPQVTSSLGGGAAKEVWILGLTPSFLCGGARAREGGGDKISKPRSISDCE